MSTKGKVVLVTGAAGFLGERIVELLDCKGDNIQEIRGFDIRDQGKYFAKNIDNKKLRYIRGDICDISQVKRALEGVNVVIHAASLISTDDNQSKSTQVNIGGTENIISGCIEAGVKGLVYTSSEAVVKGWERNKFNVDESKPYPGNDASHFSCGYYGFTKMEAERRVIEANGSQLPNGERLVTCSLRLMTLYGENSPLIMNTLKRSQNGNVALLDASSTFMPFLYVGNAAWAHVLAAKCTLTKPEVIGGQCYNITDGTPVQSFNATMKPIALASGYSISNVPISLRVMYFIILFIEWLLWLLSPLVSINLPYSSKVLFLASANITFDGEKSRKDFEYFPFYSSRDATERTECFFREHFNTSN